MKTIAGTGGTTTLTYDANHNRLRKATSSGTTSYIGKLGELNVTSTTATAKHYIYAGSNLVGTYTLDSSGSGNTRYFHTDYLGSVEAITDEAGNVVQRLSYDAFGKRRNPDGTDATGITAETTRGYTRHEQDDEVGLINMNAREYDPLLGRFITADTIIPGAISSQSYNRYSYVSNNPLSFTDPSGHSRLSRALRKATNQLKEQVARSTTHVLQQAGGVPYVGGLMNMGLLSNPYFAPYYGVSTGDWRSVGRATATAGVLAAAVYAGGLASRAYSNPILSSAQGLAYSGPTLSAAQYVGANAVIGFNSGFAVAKINGASTRDAWQSGLQAAGYSMPFTFLDIAAINMRADQVVSSLSDPGGVNAGKLSAGYRGDGIGIAGCRYPCAGSPLGGIQSKPGNLLGIPYGPDGIGNFIAEAGAGPHDFLSQWQYDVLGNTKPYFQSGVGNVLGWAGSIALLPVSIPISVGSVFSPYSSVLYSNRYIDYAP